MKLIKSGLMTAVALASFTQVLAADLSVSVEIPELDVAEYHKPYVAIWIEDDRNQVVSNLAVWYDVDMRNAEGEKWLKDMRQWWRRSGRSADLPMDGVSGATRRPGEHTIDFLSQLFGFETRLKRRNIATQDSHSTSHFQGNIPQPVDLSIGFTELTGGSLVLVHSGLGPQGGDQEKKQPKDQRERVTRT